MKIVYKNKLVLKIFSLKSNLAALTSKISIKRQWIVFYASTLPLAGKKINKPLAQFVKDA